MLTRADLEPMLANRNREQLQRILLELAAEEPDLAVRIASLVVSDVQRDPTKEATPPEPPPVDLAELRQRIEATLRPPRGGRGRRYDPYQWAAEAVAALSQIVALGRTYTRAGAPRSALAILSLVADAATRDPEQLHGDEGFELGDLYAQLGEGMAEALLLSEPPREEREAWGRKAQDWMGAASDWGLDDRFSVLTQAVGYLAAAAGEETEDEFGTDSRELTTVRLRVLAEMGRWSEYLRLAEEEGFRTEYAAALIRLHRVPAATEYGLTRLASQEEAHAVSQLLVEAGAEEEALRVAENGLAKLQSRTYATGTLARWTRDLAVRLGRPEQALGPALTALRDHISLEDYLTIPPLVGEGWPALREELLEEIRGKSAWGESKAEIFLHEGLLDDAIRVADQEGGHALVELVAEAVRDTHPDWVFRASTHQFDRIADGAKARYYPEALEWLVRAKEALQKAGREAEWRPYLEGVIARHRRKYTLRPGLEQLLKAR